MDYSRHYYFVSVLILYVLITACSGASVPNFQDVEEETQTEIIDKTDPFGTASVTHDVSSAISSTLTDTGDVIFTTEAKAIGSQSVLSEDIEEVSPNAVSEDKGTETYPPSEDKTELASAASERNDLTSMSNLDTKSTDGSTQTASSPAKLPSTEEALSSEKPKSTPSSHLPNGTSPVAPLNAFGLFLIVFFSRAVLLKT